MTGINSGRGSTTAGSGRVEENTVRFSAVAGGGAGRGGGGGGGGDRIGQQQRQQELESEVERLRRELHEQREACVAAKAEGDERQAAVEEVGTTCIRVAHSSSHHRFIRCIFF